MAPELHIRLLGQFSLASAGAELTAVHTARLQALLAYLLLHRDAPQSRQQVAFLFWPDTTDAQAHTNLRQLLHALRHRLPQSEAFLEVTDKTVRWRGDAPFTLDVVEFEAAWPKPPVPRAARAWPRWNARSRATAATSCRGATTTGCCPNAPGWRNAFSTRWSS